MKYEVIKSGKSSNGMHPDWFDLICMAPNLACATVNGLCNDPINVSCGSGGGSTNNGCGGADSDCGGYGGGSGGVR